MNVPEFLRTTPPAFLQFSIDVISVAFAGAVASIPTARDTAANKVRAGMNLCSFTS
jgi:hypothetical protein